MKEIKPEELKADCFDEKAKGIIDACYANGDWHTMYIAEVEKVLVKD